MAGVRARIAGTVLLAALTGCGGGGSSRSAYAARTVEEALPRLRQMVDATAAVVAGGLHVDADSGFLPTGCEDSAGSGYCCY